MVWDWSWSHFFTFLIPTQGPHLLQAKIWIIILTAWFLMHDAWKLYVTFARLNLYLTRLPVITLKASEKSHQIALVLKKIFLNFYTCAIEVNLQILSFSLNFAIIFVKFKSPGQGPVKNVKLFIFHEILAFAHFLL